MEKLNRWMAKHPRAGRLLMTAFWVVVEIWWLDLGVPPWAAMVFAIVAMLACHAYINAAGDRLLKKPLEVLKSQCDPYPVLEEMEAQRAYPGNHAAKQIRDINYGLALRSIGQYEQAYMLLRSINIDRHAGMQLVAKATYYNNLMDLCTLTGKYAEAVIWYEKLVQIVEDMKPGKLKEQLCKAVESNRADYHFCKGEWEQTLQVLGMAKIENLSDRIENAMMYARTYLAMGETEKAIKPLTFVAENGNKLYFALEARELLAKIHTEV